MRKFFALILTLLLTGSLILFTLAFAAGQAVSPAMEEGGIQVSDAVIREEKALAAEKINELSALYGFDPEPVIALVTDELLKDLNDQASAWWSAILTEGQAGEAPVWDAEELDRTLNADPYFTAMEDREEAEYLVSSAVTEVHRAILRMVLPIRQQTVRLGLQETVKRVDLPNLVAFFAGTLWALLALCALLSGLIVLLFIRRLKDAAQFIGSALGAAAITVLAVMILLKTAGIESMLREASVSLAFLYGRLLGGALLRAGLAALVMAAGCAALILLSGKRGKRA